jgi:hypothetical protein
MSLGRSALALLAALGAAAAPLPAAAEWDFAGDVSGEIRFFPEDAAYPDQKNSTASPSLASQPELRFDWNNGSDRLTFRPFSRWDAYDDARTHFDVREANYVHQAASWDVLLGVTRVFWGVTESVHLVDIVNQRDAVEGIDTEEKLGQPMLNLNWIHSTGTYSLFYLVGFRGRQFPEERYRLGPFPIDDRDAPFQRGAGNGYVDFALRWSHVLGDWDLGASYFHGTSREPRLLLKVEGDGDIVQQPRYDLIDQIGIDVQCTKGAWLWKLEAIYRWGYSKSFAAAVGGFEYTLFELLETDASLGWIAEFQYDGREDNPEAPFSVYDTDVFLGARLALNDESTTSLLAGVAVDVTNASSYATIEAERRLTDHLKIELESVLILHADEDDPLALIQRDDSITLRLTWSF